MNINITFRQIKSSDAIKEHVNQKMSKLEKYRDTDIEAHVILSMEKHLHHAEVIYSSKQCQITTKSSTDDMYTSIDDVVDKLEKNIQKQHSKLKSHAR